MTLLRIFDRRDPEHVAVDAMLPWFINGTLDAADRGRVERHLGTCLHCRREVEMQRQLRGHVIEPPIDDDIEASLSRVHQRLDRLEAGGFVAKILAPIREAWIATLLQRRAAWVVTFVVVGALAWPLAALFQDGASYRTLSAAPVDATGRMSLAVQFHRGAPAEAMRELLVRIGADIVSGPTADGEYVITVPALPDRQVDATFSESGIVYRWEPVVAARAQ